MLAYYNPYVWVSVQYNPPYTLNNQNKFHCSTDSDSDHV